MIENRRTLILAAALTALLAVLYVTLLLLPEREMYRPSQDQISLLSINPVDIHMAQTRRGDERHLYEQRGGAWYRDGEAVDYNATDLKITFISYLYSDNLVAEASENLGIYGLDEPRAEASFETFDGESHRVLFGIETVNQKSRYMMLEGRSEVYTVPVEAYELIFES